MITGDTRESKSDLVLASATFLDHDFHIKTLLFGDWEIADSCPEPSGPHRLTIERKKADDLLSSLGGKQANGETRMKNQLAKAPDDSPVLIIIEGGIERALAASRARAERRGSKRFWHRTSVYGLILAIMVGHAGRRAVPILHTETTEATFDLIRNWDTIAQKACILNVLRPAELWDGGGEDGPGDQ